MTLHEDKFEHIVHRHSPNSLILQLPFISELFVYTVSSGRQLRPVSELTDLGVTVSSTLMVSPGEQYGNKITRYCLFASWALSAFKAREKTTMLVPCINLRLDPNWNTAVHFGTVIKSQISKSSREFKNIYFWIIGSVSKHSNLCLCSSIHMTALYEELIKS